MNWAELGWLFVWVGLFVIILWILGVGRRR